MYRPIYNFGIFFLLIGCLGLGLLLNESTTSGVEFYFLLIFAGGISVLHIGLGIGLIIHNKSVFKIFKIYLKFLYFGFPVGTYIAKKTLDYIENHNVEP